MTISSRNCTSDGRIVQRHLRSGSLNPEFLFKRRDRRHSATQSIRSAHVRPTAAAPLAAATPPRASTSPSRSWFRIGQPSFTQRSHPISAAPRTEGGVGKPLTNEPTLTELSRCCQLPVSQAYLAFGHTLLIGRAARDSGRYQVDQCHLIATPRPSFCPIAYAVPRGMDHRPISHIGAQSLDHIHRKSHKPYPINHIVTRHAIKEFVAKTL